MRSEEKKQKLIESALDLFMKKGYENVSIAEICRRNEISKPTFYKYIPAKEQVLAHYFEQAGREAVSAAQVLLSRTGRLRRFRRCLAPPARQLNGWVRNCTGSIGRILSGRAPKRTFVPPISSTCQLTAFICSSSAMKSVQKYRRRSLRWFFWT